MVEKAIWDDCYELDLNKDESVSDKLRIDFNFQTNNTNSTTFQPTTQPTTEPIISVSSDEVGVCFFDETLGAAEFILLLNFSDLMYFFCRTTLKPVRNGLFCSSDKFSDNIFI